MKTIGMLGGMSWESTAEYYRLINQTIKKRLSGSHSAKCLLYSFDFHQISLMQHEGRWKDLEDLLIKQAVILKEGGADFLIICTNTMHILAAAIEQKSGLRVLHIVDETAKEIKRRSKKKVLLLGTSFTMQSDMVPSILSKHGIEVMVPAIDQQTIVHDIIYDQLIHGIIDPISKQTLLAVIEGAMIDGIDGVILGCTELPLLIKQEDLSIEVFDTTQIHAIAAVDEALRDASKIKVD